MKQSFMDTLSVLHSHSQTLLTSEYGTMPLVLVAGSANSEDVSVVVGLPNYPAEHKYAIMQGVVATIREQYPDLVPYAVGISSEAWAVQHDISTGVHDVADMLPPSQDPNRQECVCTAGQCVDGSSVTIITFFHRDATGRVLLSDRTDTTKHAADADGMTNNLLNAILRAFGVKQANTMQ